jgi:hypothetical protein
MNRTEDRKELKEPVIVKVAMGIVLDQRGFFASK